MSNCDIWISEKIKYVGKKIYVLVDQDHTINLASHSH